MTGLNSMHSETSTSSSSSRACTPGSEASEIYTQRLQTAHAVPASCERACCSHSVSSFRCRGTSWPDEHIGMPEFFTQPPVQAPPVPPSNLSLERNRYGTKPCRVQPRVLSSEDWQIMAFWEAVGCTALPGTQTQAECPGVSTAASCPPASCPNLCTNGPEVPELQFGLNLDEQSAASRPAAVPAAVPVSQESAEHVPEHTAIAAQYPSSRLFASPAGRDPLAVQQVVQLLASNPLAAQLLMDAAQKREGMLAHAGAVKVRL